MISNSNHTVTGIIIIPTLVTFAVFVFSFLSQSSTSVFVSNANAPAAEHLVVGGYDVSGEVRSDGEPMKGVTFLLYSATVKKEASTLCFTFLETEVDKVDFESVKLIDFHQQNVFFFLNLSQFLLFYGTLLNFRLVSISNCH